VNPGNPSLSFEFYPPKTEAGLVKLKETACQLATAKPSYFSVTYGAGGSTQERTQETVLALINEAGVPTAPHLTCVGASTQGLRSQLAAYRSNGIQRIVALRGDLPEGMAPSEKFSYAIDLIEFIRQETGDYFHLEVAAYPEYHPQAVSPFADLQNLKRKIDAGADSVITQYFYNPDAYFRFIDETQRLGIATPIIPGIMPIVNYTQLARFSDACGAEIPRWIRKRLEFYGDDLASIRSFGQDVVTTLCQQLLDGGAPGIHFYTLNNAEPSLSIWRNLQLPTTPPVS
jgi:methylenetetrahydrofolate reductase (NADPH)